MSIQRSVSATTSMRTNGASRSSVIAVLASSTNAQLRLLWHPQRSLSQEVALLRRKMPVCTWHWRMKSRTSRQWMRAETLMPSPCAGAMSSSSVASAANSDSTLLKSMKSRLTSGRRWQWWKTSATTCQHARSTMNSYMRSEAFSEALSKRLTTL